MIADPWSARARRSSVQIELGRHVNALRRLVKNIDRRFLERPSRKDDFLLVASRQNRDGLIESRRSDRKRRNLPHDFEALAPSAHDAGASPAMKIRKRNVLPDAKRRQKPLSATVRRHIDEFGGDGVRWASRIIGASCEGHRASAQADAEQGACGFLLAGSLDAAETEDLARAKREGDRGRKAFDLKRLDLKHDVARRPARLRVDQSQLASDHHGNDPLGRRLRPGEGSRQFAVL